MSIRMVGLDPITIQKAKVAAAQLGISIKQYVTEAIDRRINQDTKRLTKSKQ